METGFHLVQNDGNRTLVLGSNAIDKVADGIYHIGFELHGRSILKNEDGDPNNSIFDVANYLNHFLADDFSV